MLTLLFVDDHPLYREGFQRALSMAIPGACVLLAENMAMAIQAIDNNPDIDFCLTDFNLPDGDGLALLRRISASHPTVAKGILCGSLDAALGYHAKALGCVACLSKNRDIEGLSDAIRTIIKGGVVFDIEPALENAAHFLSDKRKEILRMASKGLSNKEIARKMDISERTVKDHWSNIFEQMGVSNRTEAVSQAMTRRLV